MCSKDIEMNFLKIVKTGIEENFSSGLRKL